MSQQGTNIRADRSATPPRTPPRSDQANLPERRAQDAVTKPARAGRLSESPTQAPAAEVVDGAPGSLPSPSPNVRWQHSEVSRRRRWQSLGARGATVWLTGLPSSGKSTLGASLEERLVEHGRHAYLLDGDNLRHGICGDLGFSQEDRRRNVERAGELACLFADGGAVAVVALVSPLAAARDWVREHHADLELDFYEVFVDTPLEVCEARDPKGLYARARAGELKGMTGIDDPYEAPARPELVVSDGDGIDAAASAVIDLLDLPADVRRLALLGGGRSAARRAAV